MMATWFQLILNLFEGEKENLGQADQAMMLRFAGLEWAGSSPRPLIIDSTLHPWLNVKIQCDYQQTLTDLVKKVWNFRKKTKRKKRAQPFSLPAILAL